ncbi:PQQ-binding-like beta-propeller repeat protein [Myxococcus qinghaiensis]|uniref:PQQ-binding-like beta-propeller repeat protein n=1 Tax=Myxococcus qinghaiensis TaxID=2906758 RepID=UPI0020A7F799|nr:PQQ-binding-like beta-propeller repeat protein [Myxococcus qinghaiensis]MCP3161938.1 PQQ-binding-like beta-propeller repeat protein [Myxococcus qinghaiensis]
MMPVNARLAALFAVLVLPSAALAQSTTRAAVFTTLAEPGETQATVVMDEVSELRVQVRNNTRSTSPQFRPINQVTFVLPTGYTLLESPAPAGWVADHFITARQVTYNIPVNCALADAGLMQDQTATFTLRMIPQVGTTNAADQRFTTLTAYEACGNLSFATNRTTDAAEWRRVGLSTRIDIQPRVLPVGDDVTARLVIENRTSQAATQNNITAEGPSTGAGGVSFEVVELQPANFMVNLPVRGAGILSARATTQTGGTMVASVRATNANGSLTSAVADSPMVNVGVLAASADVDSVQAFTGEAVRLRLSVTNTSTTASYLNVTPRAPILVGTAVATLTSGPSPASVPRLGPGASAHFVWTYTVTGAEFSSYAFNVQADATLNGSAATTQVVRSREGRIVAHRLRVSPSVLVPGTPNQAVVYTVQNRGALPLDEVTLFRPAVNFFTVGVNPTAPTGWSVASNTASFTWTANNNAARIMPNQERAFTVTYSSVGNVAAPTTFRHRMHLPLAYASNSAARIEAPVTLATGTAPEVERLTAVARDGSVTVTWDNPATHNGVLVLRTAGAAPNTLPVAGRTYAAGSTLGNATVVASESFSSTTSVTDTTVTNGTTYQYRVFNTDDVGRYSPGSRPSASAALIATPQARVGAAPLWCYSVGLDARLQPITELGMGISSSYNNSVVANLTNVTTPSADGAERWRPLPLAGLIGSRFPVVPLSGLAGQYILTADQTGVAYAINATTGTVLWRWDNTGAPIGIIQSFPVTQLHDYANPAYKAARPNVDLVFFATRLANPALNRVVALNARTGTPVFTYQPGDLGMVSGGMVVDYTTNRLFIGSKTHGGSTASLRVLNTLTGTEVARLSLGDLDHSLVRNAVANQIFATNSDGVVHAIDAGTLAPVWNVNVGTRPSPSTPAFTSFVRPLGGGFVASLASGQVAFWDYTTAGATAPSQVWTTPIANPSGTFTLNTAGVVRIYVGSSDGKVHQLEMIGGVDSRQVSIGAAQLIGTPTVDNTVSRLHVGSQDGRICAFPVPFP